MGGFISKILVFLFASIFFINLAYAVECGSIPTDGCTITQDTTFNPGVYNLDYGIRISASNILLDCNGATLQGNGGSEGIEIYYLQSNIGIKNCIVKDYEYGIKSTGYSYTGGLVGSVISDNILTDACRTSDITCYLRHSRRDTRNYHNAGDIPNHWYQRG